MLAGFHTSKALPELIIFSIFKIVLCLLNSIHIPCEISYIVLVKWFFITILLMNMRILISHLSCGYSFITCLET